MNSLNNSKKQYGIKEIALKANVSIATVDRVIHKRGGVAPKTKELILKIIDEYDYQPNILASRLRSNKTYSIAILIPEVSKNTNFWAAPYEGVRKAQEEIRQFGIDVRTYLYRLNNKSTFTEQSRNMLQDKPDGVLIAPLFVKETEHLAIQLNADNIPYAFIDSYIPDQKSVTYIGPDIYHSGFVGAKLAMFGIRQNGEVLVVNHTSITNNGQHTKEIEKGFLDYIKKTNEQIKVHTLDFYGTDPETLKIELTTYLNNHPAIQAIFVTNSRVFKIAKIIKDGGRKDIILIGFDFIDENIRYLKEDFIDFLICHKPEEQGYRGVMNLYQKLLLMQTIDKIQYMPIDIITKENCDFYSN